MRNPFSVENTAVQRMPEKTEDPDTEHTDDTVSEIRY